LTFVVRLSKKESICSKPSKGPNIKPILFDHPTSTPFDSVGLNGE
jgi:hypothetical protein